LDTGSHSYSKDSGLFSQQTDSRRRAGRGRDPRQLMHRAMPSGRLSRLCAAARVLRMHLTSQGTIEEVTDPFGLGPLTGGFGVILLTLSIFISAAFLSRRRGGSQNASSKYSVVSRPDELLAGKLIGLGGPASCRSGSIWAYHRPAAAFLSIFQVPLGHCCSRWLLTSSLHVVCQPDGWHGHAGRRPRSRATSALWSITSAIP